MHPLDEIILESLAHWEKRYSNTDPERADLYRERYELIREERAKRYTKPPDHTPLER